MNEIIKSLMSRTSVRMYTEDPVTEEEKKTILEAAVNAPSAGNMQLYSIIDVTDQAKKDRLAVLCDNQPFIKSASMVLIFLADYQKWYNAFKFANLKPRHPEQGDMLLAIEDAVIAAQNAVTAAQSMGIGSCYIGDIMENFEEVNEMFDLPECTYPACMVVFGHTHPQVADRAKPKRVDNKYVVFENNYKSINAEESEDMLSYKSQKKYPEFLEWFLGWKYNSEFSKEMSRSARLYIDKFSGKLNK